MDDKEYVLKEYLDLSTNMRHYADMRFKQLTLFSAATAALFAARFGIEDLPLLFDWLIPVAGVLVTVVFWIMEERATDHYHDFRHRAKRLEDGLEFRQYRSLQEARLVSATDAVCLLFAALAAIWAGGILLHLEISYFIVLFLILYTLFSLRRVDRSRKRDGQYPSNGSDAEAGENE